MWRRGLGWWGMCLLAWVGFSVGRSSADVGVPPCVPDHTFEVSRFGQYQGTVLSLPPTDQQRLTLFSQEIVASFKSGCTKAVVVTLTGHTDLDPSKAPDFHLKLSRERADAVRNFLIGEINKQGGAPAELLVLHSTGMGNTQLKFPNPKTMSERFQNRRVVLALASVPGPVDLGSNRPGGDYNNFPVTDIAQCHAACLADPQCKAYTFVKPGTQEPAARCWVKVTASPPVPDDCCISWAKPAVQAEGPKPEPEVGGQEKDTRPDKGRQPKEKVQDLDADSRKAPPPHASANLPRPVLVPTKQKGPPPRSTTGPEIGPDKSGTVPNQVIVLFRDRNAFRNDREHRKVGRVLREDPALNARVLHVPDVAAALEALKRNPNVLSAQKGGIRQAHYTPNDTRVGEQWHLDPWWKNKGSNLHDAWNFTRGSSSNRIAILDTGIDWRHPDLVGRIAGGWNFITNNGNYFDCEGHGTRVAGIAAAVTNNGQGVAGAEHFAKIYVAKVTVDNIEKCTGYSPPGVLATAINAVSTWPGVRVIVIPRGGYDYDYNEHLAIQYARGRNVVVVASAGNDNKKDNAYPASYQGVVGVGATDQAGKRAVSKSWGVGSTGSNWGHPNLTVVAPGDNILTTGNGDKYAHVGGTSYAAPLIGGIAMLVWARYPTATEGQIRWYLENAAWNPEHKEWNKFSDNYGKGVVDAYWAVR